MLKLIYNYSLNRILFSYNIVGQLNSEMSKNSHCFVPGCTTGYARQQKSKYSMFQPPPDKINAWQQAIPRADRELSRTDRVCELHFAAHQIIRKDRISVDENIVTIPRKRPRLDCNAVPSVFPNLPAYLSRPSKQPRRIVAKHSQPVVSKSIPAYTNTNSTVEVENADSNRSICFTDLQLCHRSVVECLPGTDWFSSMGNDVVCFGKAAIENSSLCFSVCLSISCDMMVTVYWHNRRVALLSDVDIVTSSEQLLSLMKKLDSMSECPGASSQHDSHLTASVSKSRLAWFESRKKTWRHNSCTGLVAIAGERCLPCRRYRRILQSACHQKKCKPSKRSSHLHMHVRKCRHMSKRIVRFRKMIAALRKKIHKQTGAGFQQYISMLPEYQQTAFRHCIKQATVRSGRGMRYEHKWILSCLMLRIKSPKAYSHLRDQNFLALPSKTTLQRYMDVVRAECGISTESLQLLKEKVCTPADRHGILIFDEVKLRTGVKFDMRSLVFSGLVDLNEFTEAKDRCSPADYGLVFMYRPFFGAWTQTVAMFLSNGPTRSNILTKLMLKVIVALESLDLWV